MRRGQPKNWRCEGAGRYFGVADTNKFKIKGDSKIENHKIANTLDILITPLLNSPTPTTKPALYPLHAYLSIQLIQVLQALVSN